MERTRQIRFFCDAKNRLSFLKEKYNDSEMKTLMESLPSIRARLTIWTDIIDLIDEYIGAIGLSRPEQVTMLPMIEHLHKILLNELGNIQQMVNFYLSAMNVVDFYDSKRSLSKRDRKNLALALRMADESGLAYEYYGWLELIIRDARSIIRRTKTLTKKLAKY